MSTNGFRLYLRLGDNVSHRDYLQWGEGTVVEEMTSTVSGGTCLIRIAFEDGRQRTFNNDLDADMCCYYLGMRKSLNIGHILQASLRTKRSPMRRSPRLLPKSSSKFQVSSSKKSSSERAVQSSKLQVPKKQFRKGSSKFQVTSSK